MRCWAGVSVCVWLVVCGCGTGAPEGGTEVLSVEPDAIQPVSTEVRFAAVRDLALDSESVWVLDGAAPFLTRIALADGSSVQFGGKGEGPGEFLNPVAIQPALNPDESGVWVWDLGNRRVSGLDTLGVFSGSEPLSDEGGIKARSDLRYVSYADPYRIRKHGTTTLAGSFPRRLDRTGDFASGSLRRVDRRLTPGLELVRFSEHMDDGVSGSKEWAAVPYWDLCDGTVAFWSPASSRVIWLDLEGREIESVGIEGISTPIEFQDIEAYLRWMARLELGPDYDAEGIDYAGMARAHQDRFADQHPGPTDLRCESGSVAWLRLFDTSVDPLGRGQSWLRVSKEEGPRRYQFPNEFTPAVFTADGAYGVLENPEGYQQVAWWSRQPRL